MDMNGLNLEGVRPEQARPVRETTPVSDATRPPEPKAKSDRSDRVQIADAGRALADSLASSEQAGEFSPERMAEIRQRLLEGAYESVQVVEEVARRILGCGDV